MAAVDDFDLNSTTTSPLVLNFSTTSFLTSTMENAPTTSFIAPMAMPPYYYLSIDCFILTLQTLSIFGNGFIIILFMGTPRLNQNLALRLLFSLCVTDFLFAISTLPYIIYYAKLWNPFLLDYDPMYIVTSSTPLVIQFKINLLITIMIAVDRLQAMKLPVYYRRKNQTKFVIFTIGIGAGLAIIDLIFEYSSTIFNVRRYNCAAIGCFQEPQFRAYWGMSNMALNTLALICTLWVAWEIYRMSQKSDMTQGLSKKETNKLNQANRLSFGILMISFVFLMIPSTFVGVVELTGLPVFKIIGPFYIIGLLLAGVSNSIVYITLHVEIRQAAAYLLIKKTFNKEIISTSTTKFGKSAVSNIAM